MAQLGQRSLATVKVTVRATPLAWQREGSQRRVRARIWQKTYTNAAEVADLELKPVKRDGRCS